MSYEDHWPKGEDHEAGWTIPGDWQCEKRRSGGWKDEIRLGGYHSVFIRAGFTCQDYRRGRQPRFPRPLSFSLNLPPSFSVFHSFSPFPLVLRAPYLSSEFLLLLGLIFFLAWLATSLSKNTALGFPEDIYGLQKYTLHFATTLPPQHTTTTPLPHTEPFFLLHIFIHILYTLRFTAINVTEHYDTNYEITIKHS